MSDVDHQRPRRGRARRVREDRHQGGVEGHDRLPCGEGDADAKLYEIGAGTSDIRRMLIGRELYKETE